MNNKGWDACILLANNGKLIKSKKKKVTEKGYKDVVVHVSFLEVVHDGFLCDFGQQHHVVHSALLHILTLPVVFSLSNIEERGSWTRVRDAPFLWICILSFELLKLDERRLPLETTENNPVRKVKNKQTRKKLDFVATVVKTGYPLNKASNISVKGRCDNLMPAEHSELTKARLYHSLCRKDVSSSGTSENWNWH